MPPRAGTAPVRGSRLTTASAPYGGIRTQDRARNWRSRNTKSPVADGESATGPGCKLCAYTLDSATFWAVIKRLQLLKSGVAGAGPTQIQDFEFGHFLQV